MKFKVILAGIILAVLFAAWLIWRLIAWGDCAYYGWTLERETRYIAFVGCTVHTRNNGWVPRNELRVNP